MFKDSITTEDLEKLELASFPGKIFVIDTVGAEFNRAINYLRSQKIIGFDTNEKHCRCSSIALPKDMDLT